MPKRLSPSALAHILLLAVVFVWGATFVLVKDALQDASPLLFNLLRMTLAFIALAIVNHRQLRHITRRALISGLIVGIFLAAGYQFQTAGLALTTPAKSAFITGLVVVFVPLFTLIPALRSPQHANAHAGPPPSAPSSPSPACSSSPPRPEPPSRTSSPASASATSSLSPAR